MRWAPDSRIAMRWGDFFECESDWYWSGPRLQHLDLWFVAGGVGRIVHGREGIPIGAGDCLLLRPGGSYEATHDPDRPLSLIAIHFDLLARNGRHLEPPDAELPAFQRRMEYGDLMREMLTRAVKTFKEGDRQAADAWLQAALLEVHRQDARPRPPGLLGEQAERIEALCERIRRNPEREVRVQDLAAEMHMSPEHFSRIFRHLQGIPPRAFITRTRIESAQRLLLTSSHSIAYIARTLGYRSAFYFSRHFTDRVGVSPSAYRAGERSG